MTQSDAPILIAGPTASGKSALALRLAALTNGCVINADALQVYDCWSVLSARPDKTEMAQAPHWLYGHIGKYDSYSTGHWLRDVESCLQKARAQGLRPIIVGGTGLYFGALTQGLAPIPPVPEAIRAAGNALREQSGKEGFIAELTAEDPETLAGLDANNPARLQRAWEVLRATGKGLSRWQADTPPPLVAPHRAVRLHLDADRDWLAERIGRRFDQMMELGALEEVKAYVADGWDGTLPSAQAIGAKELVAHLHQELDLPSAIESAKIQTRQYAKRQRTWFRKRMADWTPLDPQKEITEQALVKIASTFS
ncbi:tRNA (adenosine(37)-N6)-dimethylallyltransferase MiaA [Neptunicoccus sediminis]|uniref:tRNA (adenosine(37)-N6)-dimethylallyltransferase MiaA n=1 Tax=Neptunicoccus sediminis TaxID=1892596 RepID=UPI000845DD04|nr:tRNA (adenosine(37)-N6)-dimethylallyltransferase MiaA [Neptunicoccus sediminis]